MYQTIHAGPELVVSGFFWRNASIRALTSRASDRLITVPARGSTTAGYALPGRRAHNNIDPVGSSVILQNDAFSGHEVSAVCGQSRHTAIALDRIVDIDHVSGGSVPYCYFKVGPALWNHWRNEQPFSAEADSKNILHCRAIHPGG